MHLPPGDELEGKDVDCLYTTPEKLHTWICTIINPYNFSQEGTLIREARDLMNPTIIQRCEELKILVRDKSRRYTWKQSKGRDTKEKTKEKHPIKTPRSTGSELYPLIHDLKKKVTFRL